VAIPGHSEEQERLLAMVTGLACELAVTRERLDTLERLLQANGVVVRAAIDGFVADDAAAGERDALRQQVIDAVLRPIRHAAERAADEAEETSR
jgi:hypothetical protein